MGPGNFTTKCLGFPRPFFNLISILQNALPAKVEVGPGPFHKVALPQNDL